MPRQPLQMDGGPELSGEEEARTTGCLLLRMKIRLTCSEEMQSVMRNHRVSTENHIGLCVEGADLLVDKIHSFFNVSFAYYIDYTITFVPVFPPLPLSTQHSSLLQAIPTPLVMSMDHMYKFFGYSISCSVTTYLYFFIPSPLHLFPHTPLPPGNH